MDTFDLYSLMERDHVLLAFKGSITSDLLTSVLQIMESKMDDLNDAPKTKRRVFNVLVECLQNLYHHLKNKFGYFLALKSTIGCIENNLHRWY